MADHHEEHEHHIVPLKVYFLIFGLLLVFTALTVGAAFVDMGVLNNVVALTIASIKASVVVLYFMHARYGNKVNLVVIGGTIFWLLLLFVLLGGDYATRDMGVFPQRDPISSTVAEPGSKDVKEPAAEHAK